MKKLIVPLIIMVALFLTTGCSEKFNIAAPYKNMTVIYAFLDRADTAHYVRVQKAFLDQTKSAVSMAKESDSNFYKNINVRINRLSAADSSFIDTIHLDRVNLDAEGYPKQPGAFFTAPNYAYKFKGDLNPNYLYRIIVTNLTTGQIDSSTAPVINDIPTFPATFYIDVIDDAPTNLGGMDFAQTGPNQTFNIGASYNQPAASPFSFEGQVNPVSYGYPIVRFHWVDSNYTTGAMVHQYYDYASGGQSISGAAASRSTIFTIRNIDLYNALATGMGTAPASTARLLDRVEIIVYLSTLDYYTYLQAAAIQGVGLTGNEIEPIYTNVKGHDALGLFTSRGVRSGFMTMTYNTVDSLKASTILTKANITGTLYH